MWPELGDLPALYVASTDLVVADVAPALSALLRVASVDQQGWLLDLRHQAAQGGGVWPKKTVTATAIESYGMVTAVSGAFS